MIRTIQVIAIFIIWTLAFGNAIGAPGTVTVSSCSANGTRFSASGTFSDNDGVKRFEIFVDGVHVGGGNYNPPLKNRNWTINTTVPPGSRYACISVTARITDVNDDTATSSPCKAGIAEAPENCFDEIENDCDGKTDCDDKECEGKGVGEWKCCRGSKVNTKTDPENCGDCGKNCDDNNLCTADSCSNGSCENISECENPGCGVDEVCDKYGCCVPGITLLSFTAEVDGGNVILSWETACEVDNAGFNLWRSKAGEERYVKLNKILIRGQGNSNTDVSYRFIDTGVTAGVTYDYKLEDVDIHGVSTFHGLVSVTLEKPQFTLQLDAGINLISVPLNPGEPWMLRHLADFIGKDNVDVIIYLNNGRFIGYNPDLADDLSANVPIAGDEAYIVVVKSPAELTFTGEAWDGKVSLSKGLNTMSVPVNPGQWRLSDLASHIGPNLSSIIWYDGAVGRFVGYNSASPEVGDTIIRGGGGYFVSMTEPADLTFEGEAWMNTPAAVASPPALIARDLTATPLLIIEGTVLRKDTGQKLNDIEVTIRNYNTGSIVTTSTDSMGNSGRYVTFFADLNGNRAAQVADVLEVTAWDATGALEAKQIKHIVTEKDVQAGKISLGEISLSPIPKKSLLLANYPNPFNPETWIPYKLSEAADVTLSIYNVNGQLVRTLSLGCKNAGTYVNREKSAYWDGRNDFGENVASGVYFYSIQAGKFSATRKMLLRK